MFFNYDLFEIIAIGFIVSGILTYSFYKSAGPINNESLVNTSALATNSDLSNNLATNPASQLIDAGVQTEANTYVNTGIQTSPRMWLESVRNWITEILSGASPTNPNPQATGQYVDVGVQTNATSLWDTVKQWFLEVLSVKASELSSIGYGKVEKWTHGIAHSTVESCNTISSVSSQSSLQQLVTPNDSASNITEIISESNLRHPDDSASNIIAAVDNKVYDITDVAVLDNFIENTPTAYIELINNVYYVVNDNVLLSIAPTVCSVFI
jgi:hypothetical protein